MTFLIARTEVNSCEKPIVWFMYQNPNTGFLEDVFALDYEIWDASTPLLELNPALVQPIEAVPLEDCPLGAKLGIGRYAPTFSPQINWSLGTHYIRWYWKTGPTAPTQTANQYFRVTDEQYGPNVGYVSIDDLLAAGLVIADVDGGLPRVRVLLRRASEFIDQVTKRHFCPEFREFRKNGLGGPRLILRESVMSIEDVQIVPNDTYGDFLSDINTDFYFYTPDQVYVFNRWLRYNLREPDDRDTPMLELSYWSRPAGAYYSFPDGSQDVQVRGVFGYMDWDGSPLGKVPAQIEFVAALLVNHYIPPALPPDGGGDQQNPQQGIFVKKERTRDQEITYGGWGFDGGGNGNGGVGNQDAPYTGVIQIDRILQQMQLPCVLMLGA